MAQPAAFLPPELPNDHQRAVDEQTESHRLLRAFGGALRALDEADTIVTDATRPMFIFAATLLKKSTIPVLNVNDVAHVKTLWDKFGWRGLVFFPTETVHFEIPGQEIGTEEQVNGLILHHQLPSSRIVNLQRYGLDDLVEAHRDLAIYGFWARRYGKLGQILSERQSLYWNAAVRLLNERCLPVVNEEDVIAVANLRNVFGCIAIPMYPYKCDNFNDVYTNALTAKEVRQFGDAAGFPIYCIRFKVKQEVQRK